MGKGMRKHKDTAPKKAAAVKRRGEAAKPTKQPKHRAVRAMKKMASKVVENTKTAIFLRGTRTSELCGGMLKELFALRKPHGVMMQRKNENMHPFEDSASLEFLCQKNDASLFCVANHSKKRPNNLVIGRTFDGHLLDMVELGLEGGVTLQDLQETFPEATIQTKRLGSKPCVVFVGEAWEQSGDHRRLRSVLLDFVRGQDVTAVNLASLDHVIAFTAAADKVFMRTYALNLKKPAADSTSTVPRTKLVLSAPSADFTVRRTRWAAKDLLKRALKQPTELRAKKVKNVRTTAMGDTVGQLHMQRQDWSTMQTRKVRALHAHKAVRVLAAKGGLDDGMGTAASAEGL